MISDVPNDQMCLHNETNNNNKTDDNNEWMKVNDIKISYKLTIKYLLTEDWISYCSYSVLCDNLYNDIKNKSKISKHVIGLLLEMSHVINNTTNKSIALSQLL